MKLGIEGFHAIITGGTKGLGKAIITGLLREGCNVSYCARKVNVDGDDFGGDVQLEPGVKTKAQAVGTVVDVGDKEALTKWVQASAEKFGRLDIVISNATPYASQDTVEDWTMSFQIDILGCVNLVHASEPFLENSPAASIIIMGSAVQREACVFPGATGANPYGPLKAALTQHSNNLAHVLGPKGIRVNTICPGNTFVEGGIWDTLTTHFPEESDVFRKRTALGQRFAKPEEIADVTIYTASPRASFVSGSTVMATGAFHIGTQF